MCGRARCTMRPDDVPRACHHHGVPARFLHTDRYRPSYNVAPGSYMPVLRRDNEAVGVTVHCMKWGLVPNFTKKTDKPDFFKMFNARSESVTEKPSFRRLLPKNRCLVAVDGFYEWKKEGSRKQPYYIHFKDERPLVFAALFDSWQNSGGETLYTFTILTTSSSSALHWLHDRMPVILSDKDSVNTWLDDPSTSKLKPLLAPYENSDLVWYPVTPAIGKPTFDGPECIQQILIKENSLISKFFSTKQPKTDEGDKETKSTDANIPVYLKEEPTVEGYEGAVFSNSITKIEEPDEEKNIGFQKIVKAEALIEDNSSVEEGTNGEDKSLKTGLTYETGERNCSIPTESDKLDLPGISKEEPKTQGKPGNENEMTVLTCPTSKEGGLEVNEKSSGKSGTKRGYESFSAEEKPWKHSEMLQDAKSCGKHGRKQGKGKSNTKKSKESQSTLHFFFDEK